MIEDLYSAALELCQMSVSSIRKELGNTPLKREHIEQEVDEILTMRRFKGQLDREKLIQELEQRFTIWSDAPSALASDDDHQPWLAEKLDKQDYWKFWTRYKLYLLRKQQMSPVFLQNMEWVVDEVLGRLEDPTRPAPWDRRGLVMGDVQSGKTGTYIGLICKAADAGYKVIIVLAGLHNNLRSQTQIRLDEGFLGYKAVPPNINGTYFEPTGVHEFGTGAGLKADSITNRENKGDFNKAVAKQFNIHPGGNALLFVVKKNVSVLTHLLNYIKSKTDATDPNTGRKYHRDTPLLVIDDEADQASVDTKTLAYDEDGKPDEEHNPTRTNELIRRLLHAFDKSAYVGFTATPFANIFIHERATTNELGEDLFPKNFIVNLPAPSNYMGAARVFGIREDRDIGLSPVEALPITRLVSDYAESLKTDETEGWMPPRLLAKTDHRPLWQGERRPPPSVLEAIRVFLLAACVRTLREDGLLVNSMLIHVVRFMKVQNEVKQQVEAALKKIAGRLRNGDGNRSPSILDEFRQLWESDFVPTTDEIGPPYQLPDWAAVAKVLPQVAESVVVKAINGTAADALDYEKAKETGLNVIAVGGDKLSRGLTLDGLIVSYFLRSSRTYDTLMQMGRWFGYREKYLDVCRLYITAELEQWYRDIAAATEELRQEFDYMVSIGANPRQYGLKVRSHPSLTVTSAAKMRTGTELMLSFSGAISETIIFDKNESIIKTNFDAFTQLVKNIAKPPTGRLKAGYLWKEVDASHILTFLDAYVSHPDARRADSKLLARYIRKQTVRGELVDWSVRLASSSTADPEAIYRDIINDEVGAIKRAPYPAAQSPNRYTIRRLVSPADEYADLSTDEHAAALAQTRKLWQDNPKKDKPVDEPDTPAGKGIRFARPKQRGMLIIYLLDPRSAEKSREVPFTGIAVSFPESDTAEPVSYMVTNVFANAGDYDDL